MTDCYLGDLATKLVEDGAELDHYTCESSQESRWVTRNSLCTRGRRLRENASNSDDGLYLVRTRQPIAGERRSLEMGRDWLVLVVSHWKALAVG